MMEKIGMSERTKKFYHNYIEAKETLETLKRKIALIEPYYKLSKALYDSARLTELKQMDYKPYLQTEEWERKRRDAVERARGVCEKCGSPDNLQVHHKTYERRGEELPEDLIVLCSECHKKEHGLSPEMAKE
jgi:hypothetical protein